MKVFVALVLMTLLATPCLAASKPAVPVFAADTSQTPDLQPWGHVAEALCTIWYPRILANLHGDDSKRPVPPIVKIVFEKDMKGVAYTSGPSIHIAADWVRAHPMDFGMVVHELTHVVQRYPTYKPSWLVEGIADYVRGYTFEPDVTLPRINFAKANYTDAYKTTAAFLLWIEKTHDKDIVPQLSLALSRDKYAESLFQDRTGRALPVLWAEFSQASPAPAPKSVPVEGKATTSPKS